MPLCNLYADLVKLDGTPRSGVVLKGKVKYPTAIHGSIIDDSPISMTTNAQGHAELDIEQGAIVDIMFTPLRQKVVVNTTGFSTINLADIVSGAIGTAIPDGSIDANSVLWLDAGDGLYYSLLMENGALIPVEHSPPTQQYQDGESIVWYDANLDQSYKLMLVDGVFTQVAI